jgi:hypothetical protein
MKTMEWIDLTSLKMLTITIWLAIYAAIIPQSVIGTFAFLAAVSTICLNAYRYYNERKKQKNDDGATKKSN